MVEVTLHRTQSESEDQVVRNLFAGYFADMARYDDNLVINQYGVPTWKPFGLPGPTTLAECATFNWWIRDKCDLYLIRFGGAPAGFAIVLSDRTHLYTGVDFELMDFFIAPKYRAQGIGTKAARQIFEERRGAWQLFILLKNEPARSFWRKIVNEYSGGNYRELQEGTEIQFNNTSFAREK
jgi:predicted acetyltransferase